MAKIIWSNILLPDLVAVPKIFFSDIVPDFPTDIPVRFLEIDHAEVELPAAISRRSLSRTGILLNLVTLPVAPIVEEFLKQDRFSVGIYGAIEPGPTDFNVAKSLSKASGSEFTKKFKNEMSPKAYFYSMPNMPVAQIAIYLNSHGRSTAYTHSELASAMALEQAEWDLRVGTVKAALVCGAFSLENPFVVLRESRERKKVLCEGAGAVLLVAGEAGGVKSRSCVSPNSFGCINDLIGLLKEGSV